MWNFFYLLKMSNKLESKEMSFVDIFRKYKYKVLIPSIQRDYAQGRTNAAATTIRKNFVKQLKEYIFNEGSHSLDFIYGSQENGLFIPLDGQQRLTTLWLLHIYLLCANNNKVSEKDLNIFEFTYQTRDSSKRFCRAFLSSAGTVLNHRSLETIVEDKDAPNGKRKIQPSELIRNEGWWFVSWDEDPTINGMLNMLDEIDKVFFDEVDDAYEKLFNVDTYPIVFEFLPLKGFHDIDDLYIKMNARGLPLTPFEIFKSKLIEDVEKNLPEEEKIFKANIDVYWSDTLWMAGNQINDNNIDKFFQRILIVLLANEGSLTNNGKIIDSLNLDFLFEANNKKVTFAHNWYERKGIIFNKSLLSRLNADLEILLNKQESPLEKSSMGDGYDSFWFDIIKAVRRWILNGYDIENEANLSYLTRLKLHSFLIFRKTFRESSDEELSEWMRIIHNLMEASPIDSSSDMVNALKGVENMLDTYCEWRKDDNIPDSSINSWVSESLSYKPPFVNKDQWQEEVIKAQLRQSEEWKVQISRAEHHPYLKGQIGVLLWLAKIIGNTTPFANLQEIPSSDRFKSYLEKVYTLFERLGDAKSEEITSYLMVKAMLAYGDYMPDASSSRKNFYNRPNHRDYSWKNLFRITSSNSNQIAMNCLKQILDNPSFNVSDISKSLSSITKSQKEPSEFWRQAFLGKYGAKLMGYAKQGFIAFDGDNVLIYGSSQRNHYHAELKSLLLYEYLREQPGLSPKYYFVRSQEERPDLFIHGFSIQHWNNTWKVLKDNEWKSLQNEKEVLDYIGVPQTVDYV